MVYVAGLEYHKGEHISIHRDCYSPWGYSATQISTFPHSSSYTPFPEETPEIWLPCPLIPFRIISLIITIKSARAHHPLKDSYLLERVEPGNDPNPYDA